MPNKTRRSNQENSDAGDVGRKEATDQVIIKL
jgi:hypothetical protein